jgi:hypothetical protein
MRAGDFLTDGVGREFDVFLAKGTGHFQGMNFCRLTGDADPALSLPGGGSRKGKYHARFHQLRRVSAKSGIGVKLLFGFF